LTHRSGRARAIIQLTRKACRALASRRAGKIRISEY
jgi:hypothetical protein